MKHLTNIISLTLSTLFLASSTPPGRCQHPQTEVLTSWINYTLFFFFKFVILLGEFLPSQTWLAKQIIDSAFHTVSLGGVAFLTSSKLFPVFL